MKYLEGFVSNVQHTLSMESCIEVRYTINDSNVEALTEIIDGISNQVFVFSRKGLQEMLDSENKRQCLEELLGDK